MTTHTPGPWAYIDATKVAAMQYKPECVIKSGQKQIASFSWNDKSPWFPSKIESQANARLIAAAPELLEALILLEHEMVESGNARSKDYGWLPAIEKTRAAIAKATGT